MSIQPKRREKSVQMGQLPGLRQVALGYLDLRRHFCRAELVGTRRVHFLSRESIAESLRTL
jgi:hypothetical protein